MAVRRQRSVSGPLDVTAWRGADRTKRSGGSPQAQRRTPLPQILRGEQSPVDAVFASLGPTFEEEMVDHVFGEANTPDPQAARRSLTKERDGTEELDGAQQNVTLLQNKVTQRREALAKQQDLVENTRTLDDLLHEQPASQLTWSPTCDEPASASRRPRRRSKTSPDLLRSLDGADPFGTSPQSGAVAARPATAGRNRAGELASLLDNALLGGESSPGPMQTGANAAPRAEFGAMRVVAGRRDLVQQLCVGTNLERTVRPYPWP